MDRNVIGNGDAYLRSGPTSSAFSATTVKPPLGVGSLGLRTGNSSDKVAFGNQVDFAGDLVSDLNQVGYSVFTTGENNRPGNNMPSIQFEIDPNLSANAEGNYSTLVYVPANGAANQWTEFDADADTGRHWGLTGGYFNEPTTMNERCGLNGSRCTFEQVKAYLNDDGAVGDATIFTVGVNKGRDYAFSGAVDALTINSEVFDFEPFGVTSTTSP
jgi:hypothetical protein